MKLSLARIKYRLGIVNHKMEFLFILTWMLFLPGKESFFYFLSTAALLCFFLFRNSFAMKTLGFSAFNKTLPLVVLVLAVTIFFSNNYLKSLQLFSDMLLVICYFSLFYNDRRKEEDLFHLVAYIITAFSLFNIVLYFIHLVFREGQRQIFFGSTIYEGIISGLGILIFLFYLLKGSSPGRNRTYLVLILVNWAALFTSQSKAAYLGTVLAMLLLFIIKRKRWIPFLVLFVVLTLVIPNPVRSMVYRAFKADPYSSNRIDIWKMCVTMYEDHPLTGVGLDNFAEFTPAYNFVQPAGPVNYFKVPRHTHSDYLKLIVETGIAGMALLGLLFYLLARKLFSSSLFNLSSILILYLLFQALLFNLLFTTFFFFIFMFLLKSLLERKVTFKSFPTHLRYSISCLLVIVFLAVYLLPWLSERYTRRSLEAANTIETYHLLNKAGALNPLDANIHYEKAAVLLRYFRRTSNPEAFSNGLEHLKKAQRLHRRFSRAYLLEAWFYLELLNKRAALKPGDREIFSREETIDALKRAEKYNPLNPFIKMEKAKVYMAFGSKQNARREAEKAIALEPDYVEALYFLHRFFNHIPDEQQFHKKIAGLQEKARYWEPEPGDYVDRIYQVPHDAKK
jgi:O-antigen ligase